MCVGRLLGAVADACTEYRWAGLLPASSLAPNASSAQEVVFWHSQFATGGAGGMVAFEAKQDSPEKPEQDEAEEETE